MNRAALLLALAAACGPLHAYQNPGKATPTWRYAVDAVGTTAGLALSVDGYTNGRGQEMAIGAGLLALFWLPYFFVETR